MAGYSVFFYPEFLYFSLKGMRLGIHLGIHFHVKKARLKYAYCRFLNKKAFKKC